MPNSSSISEFLLLALADTRQLQLLHFWLLLGIYLAALLGNGLISTAVACDHRLHTPMYFFLLNLALLDLGCISTTLPKAMANALWHTRHISYAGCAAQVFFLLFLFSTETFLLTIMSYDRYVAICKPLHYRTLLGSRPHSLSSTSLDLVVAVLYSVVPPIVNPLIYSMRNQELRDALRKLWKIPSYIRKY
ncbi:olfactory receptor 14J1-like isoform X2 [Gallus gallus]|uniref:olfactory receptor 14J1-like isoform X2 n=1 Tax=Gallus gallus TaxID=9031 RepID=UPI001AE8F2C7|nr:olfactory receptor 14J1-like isoform X2 [Gallus gallus]